ncbi:hypothetical protein PG984_010231 [Apiospora sp. TS-2023a]
MQPKPRPCQVPNCPRDIEDHENYMDEEDDMDEEDEEEDEEEEDEKVKVIYCEEHCCRGLDDGPFCGRSKSESADQCPACTCTWVYQPGGCDSDNHIVGERCERPVEGDNGRCEDHDPPCSSCQDNRATRSWSGDRDEPEVCWNCYESFSWMRKSKSKPKPKPKSVKTKKPLVVTADGTRLVRQDGSLKRRRIA